MTEQVNLIPARLKSAVVGGHVAGADQIIDDNLGKTQNAINAETNSKFEQIDNEIEGFEKQDVVPVDTLPDVATADPKKIYRVVDETTYTDYMVNATGDGWKKIYEAEFPGIDAEPTAGSDNLVKSGSVAEIANLTNSLLSKDVLYSLEAGEYKDDGTSADNYYRVRTKNAIPASPWTLEVNSGYLIHRICYYNQDGTFNKYVNGNTQYSGLKFVSTEKLIAKITFRNSAGTHLEPTENIISSFKFDYNINDEVSALKTNLGVATADINNISNEVYGGNININSITFTRGGINSSTGVPQPDVNFARANTDQYFDKRKHTIICDSTLYKILRIYRYNDTNGDFVDAENINVTTYVNNGEYYSKYEFVRLDGNNFADAHPTGLLTSITYNSGIKAQLNGLSFWKGTQAEYDALGTYDNNTVYFII